MSSHRIEVECVRLKEKCSVFEEFSTDDIRFMIETLKKHILQKLPPESLTCSQYYQTEVYKTQTTCPMVFTNYIVSIDVSFLYLIEDLSIKLFSIVRKINIDIESNLCLILDEVLSQPTPVLPIWLAPIQLIIIPTSPELKKDAVEISKKLRGRIRVDSSNEKFSKKLRKVANSLIPIIGIISERDKLNNTITLKFRKNNSQKTLTIEEANRLLNQE
ncbi:hypothetical protein HS7_08330 [Sulfolobales archaeon HS-7]|nr:hypothetical protein HS7_08330 [Sulfolobales archaeon HS-7]